jgi:nucleotide-binding universal stress UspA family protein
MLRHVRVLFPTDFSPFSEFAFAYALALARRLAGRLDIVHVLDTNMLAHGSGQGFWLGESEMADVLDSMQEHAQSRLTILVDMAGAQGVEAGSHVLRGQPVPQIIEAARQLEAGMVVMPSHGRTGLDRLVFGSTSERVMRHCPAPVLVIKHPEHEFVTADSLEVRLARVLFPTDFSEFSLKGLPYAVSLCREFGAELVLAYVAEVPIILPELMPEVSDGLDADQVAFAETRMRSMAEGIEGVQTDVVVRRGQAPQEIAGLAQDRQVDLIVIPTHGRSGIRHVFWGSVAEKVTRWARCPVLIIHPEEQASS